MSAAQTGANTIKFNDLMDVAKLLGAEAGKGKDTQIKFMLKTVEGAYHGAIDLTANKHTLEVDDAVKLAEAYVTAQNGAIVFDAKAPNQRKLVSTLRTSIKLGMWPKGGNGEPLATVNNLMTMRLGMRKRGEKRLDDATNTLMKYARAQIRRDTLIDNDDELKGFCMKPEAENKTAEEIITACRDQLQKLIEGKAAKGTAHDNDPEIHAAKNALTKRLIAIAKTKPAKAKV